jgi:MFS family permease
MAIAFVLGLCLSGVNILAQTTVQEESAAHIRGRVLSLQFMLSSLVSILPMLALGAVADAIGIPKVFALVGAGAIVVAAITYYFEKLAALFRWLVKLWQNLRKR